MPLQPSCARVSYGVSRSQDALDLLTSFAICSMCCMGLQSWMMPVILVSAPILALITDLSEARQRMQPKTASAGVSHGCFLKPRDPLLTCGYVWYELHGPPDLVTWLMTVFLVYANVQAV